MSSTPIPVFDKNPTALIREAEVARQNAEWTLSQSLDLEEIKNAIATKEAATILRANAVLASQQQQELRQVDYISRLETDLAEMQARREKTERRVAELKSQVQTIKKSGSTWGLDELETELSRQQAALPEIERQIASKQEYIQEQKQLLSEMRARLEKAEPQTDLSTEVASLMKKGKLAAIMER